MHFYLNALRIRLEKENVLKITVNKTYDVIKF